MELTARTDAEVAADAVLGCARAALGCDVTLAGPPEPVVSGFGPGMYACRLAGAPPSPSRWSDPVLVRVGATGAVRREREWHAFCTEREFPVPEVLGLLDTDDAKRDRAALVVARGPSLSLMEGLGQSPMAIPALLRSMAELHARLHRVPTDGAPVPADEGPHAELDRALTAAGLGGRFASERAWLDAHASGPGVPVVCHGDVQPASMRLDGDDPASAQLVNWSRACLAEPEYDVALTLLMFWSAPYLAEGIGQRKMLKTVRDMITEGYRAAYEAAPGSRPLDDLRLRYWGAFHALSWSVRLAAPSAAGGPVDLWDPVALVQHVDSYRKDLARRFSRLTRG